MNEIREAMENKNSIEIETMKTQIAMLEIKILNQKTQWRASSCIKMIKWKTEDPRLKTG